MLKIPYLRNILLTAFFFAIAFPMYEVYYIFPAYQALLIEATERDALRFVRSVTIRNNLEKIELRADRIPESFIQDIVQLKNEGILVKLRVFSALGEIVFSTQADEVGTVNDKDYFRESVAKGHLYSELVHKESMTADGTATDLDLIETYVPVMLEGQFHGAMEIYSDITPELNSLRSNSRHSFSMLVTVSIGLLVMMFLVLLRARNSIVARTRAEVSLRGVNENLENRVEQRTHELSTANQLLASEISERKRAQHAQREAFVKTLEARDRVNAIISSVADALLVTDHHDSILLINPAAEKLFNVKASDVIGCRLPDVIGLDNLLLEIAKVRTELANSDSIDFDFIMSSDSSPGVYQCRASRLRETAVNGRGLILFIHDVTRERQIDQMKTEFVSMAAHELQTPLTMVLGYSELLLDHSKQFEPHERREFLQIINDKSVELSGLIDDILDLSRIEDGHGLKLTFTHVNLAALCQQVVADFEKVNTQHRFATEFTHSPVLVDADEARLIQVMENLLGNAVKYSPDGGLIRVVLKQEENWIRLDVIDQGIGMTDEERANAFERFYRADASNTAARGTGLGLSITKYIVDAHAGGIEIFSRKGKGTRLEIRLPLVR